MNGTIEGFCSAVLKHIREDRQRVIDKMSHGGLQDYTDYKICMGQIQALDSVEARIKQLISIHSGDDDAF